MRARTAVEMISTLDEPAIVLKKLRAIRAEIADGVYDPVQVVGVSNALEVFLAYVNSKPRRRVTRTALYGSIGASKSVVSKVVAKRHIPRMENFFPIVDGLIENFEDELGLGSISLDAFQGLPALYVVVPIRRERSLATLSELLAELVDKVRSSNSSVGGLLGELEKKQLIIILETALNQLKSPAIEVNSLRKVAKWLREFANKSLKKGVETLAGNLASSVAEELVKLLKGLLQ